MTNEKIKEIFDGMVVKKSSVQGVFSSLSIPSFIRDWFLKKYANQDGEVNINFVLDKINDIIPKKDEWNNILDKIMNGATVKILVKLKVLLNIDNGQAFFELPDYGVTFKETIIPEQVWRANKKGLLLTDGEFWGIVDLAYNKVIIGKKEVGKITMVNFTDFRPYSIDLKFYKQARTQFSSEEWIDMLLGAIDYNANGFENELNKLTMLSRLLPFIEKRLNLIELAPKGTGKSYIFSQISKKGWLVSGGVMTRAKMFYDMQKKQEGLINFYDYVALDEISTIKFPDIDEMRGALKGYLESGEYNVGIKHGTGDSGIMILGNINQADMDVTKNMFNSLPELFEDSALIDRFHGFIKGWEVPRMNEQMKIKGWALNTEYFSEIMHALREDITQQAVVDKLLYVPKDADTRDTKAVKKIATAYTKLLFPHYEKVEDVDLELFDKYCLQPAISMRQIIRTQLGIMDEEFASKMMPEFRITTEEER